MSDDANDNRTRHPSERPEVSLPTEVVDAVAAELDDALAERADEWPGFGAAVWARIDDTPEDALGAGPAWASIAETLRADHAAAVTAFEVQHGEFADGVGLRWAEHAECDASTLGDVLRDDVASAVAAKDGVWSAFAQQVMVAIDRSERGPAEAADQAIAALRREVESELDAMAPRFDRAFREGVERRIFRAGRQSKTWWGLLGAQMRTWVQPAPGLGVVAAAAAAVALMVLRPTAGPPLPPEAGEVSISAVRFDGTVTVMPDEGIAVVWVTGDAS